MVVLELRTPTQLCSGMKPANTRLRLQWGGGGVIIHWLHICYLHGPRGHGA